MAQKKIMSVPLGARGASKYAAISATTDCVRVVSSSSSEMGIPYHSMMEAQPEVCTGGMGEEPPDTEDAQ